MGRRDQADHHGAAANGRRTDIGQGDLPVREQAEGALMTGRGPSEFMRLPVRRTDGQHGGKKQQEGQQTSER